MNYPGTNSAARNPEFRRVVNGVNPDMLVVQEMISQAGMTEFLDSVMNRFTPGKYTSVPFNDGPDTDNGLFFRTDRWDFVSASYIPTALRNIAEYVMQPKNSTDQIRIYSVHLKASTGTTNEEARLQEATIVRNHLNALPLGSKFIVLGDFNIYRSTEPAFQKLIGSEANNQGQLKDPLNLVGIWNSNAAFAPYHTQSTRTRAFGGGATGGLDDRFDMILISHNLDSQILTSTYTAYGNDGNHLNDSINRLPNFAVPDSIARALHNASDHLPVFASFVFPVDPLPIQLSYFHGAVNSVTGNVDLFWGTLSEINNFGFEAQKSEGGITAYSTLPNGFVPGNGTTTVPQQYSFTDSSVTSGSWWYRLKQIDLDGTFHFTDGIRVDVPTHVNETIPLQATLSQNYPNPFNPSTEIEFSVGATSHTTLLVFNVLGQRVATLYDDIAEAGSWYRVRFEGTHLASGVYLYRLLSKASTSTSTKQMVLLK